MCWARDTASKIQFDGFWGIAATGGKRPVSMTGKRYAERDVLLIGPERFEDDLLQRGITWPRGKWIKRVGLKQSKVGSRTVGDAESVGESVSLFVEF